MKKLCIVAGTRPNLIKVEPLIAASKAYGLIVNLVDTRQHYDSNMREVFYKEFQLPQPIDSVPEDTDCIIVIGDTNSTVAGALMACEMGIPLAHVEAGCRCWDKTLPEEVNRIIVDGLSDFLFCPTKSAAANVSDGIFVGDVLYDQFKKYAPAYVGGGGYALVTIHRQSNTRDREVVKRVISDALEYGEVVFPVHPRTRPLIDWELPVNVHVVDPFGYKEMLRWLSRADYVITDSGGVQREAYWMGVPFTLERTSSSWPETLFEGNSYKFGDGMAAYKIMEILADA